jgi:hypothetical protein
VPTQLYSDPSRFIYEVIQNADDSHYSNAEAAGYSPCISFKVYDDRIIIDYIEDGFDEKSVKAICGFGNSSKRGTQGYIGAKGIGFKSVFAAAWKVHIQSGYYSFHFKYQKGDNELDMVSPIWEDPDPYLAFPTPMTRMTLFLHDTGDSGLLSSQRHKIQEQLDGMDQTVLLFMRKLKEVYISFRDEEQGEQRSATFSALSTVPDSGMTILTRTDSSVGNTINKTPYYYHVTRVPVDDLPGHDDRQQSGQEAPSEVILAFPVDHNSCPIITHQQVFAFLPVRPMGFSVSLKTPLYCPLTEAVT